ncbi:protein CLT1, chloroplastic-like [Durio zibethinus]|uniref:Protein CLT1, chloroplastic-like n=1 Tax=Durio zibethinus TaxID=66656 RepID=A0A6P5YMF9_DURZI|nr:protein CLT1, chloroplastic-like [Durio zibethinus]
MVALFGYADEAGFEKQIEQEHSGHSRNPSWMVKSNDDSTNHSLKEVGIFWSLLMIVSFFLQAADSVLKEVIFLDAAQRLKGGSVDLFVVNSYGSAFQVSTV